jgi:hypothetical protein
VGVVKGKLLLANKTLLITRNFARETSEPHVSMFSQLFSPRQSQRAKRRGVSDKEADSVDEQWKWKKANLQQSLPDMDDMDVVEDRETSISALQLWDREWLYTDFGWMANV